MPLRCRAVLPVLLLASSLLGAASLRAAAAEPLRPPEIRSARWFNAPSQGPPDQKGKIRLVAFWTFGCVNCVRTVPALRRLHALGGQEVLLLGVHSPEFEREKDPRKVKEAIRRLKVTFPVAMDNDGKNWLAFDNRYWPTLYLLDRDGTVVHSHVGELHEGTEAWKDLLWRIEGLRRKS